MAQRIATIVGVIVIAGILAFIGYNFWANPVGEKRQWLNQELSEIQPIEVIFDKPQWDFKGWQDSVAGKPALWEELIEPPKAPPPPPPTPPNLNAMLKGVRALRQGVGKRAKIITPGDARGAFMGVGDMVNGLRIKEVTKTAVTFSLEWQGQELTTSIPRE